MLKITTVDGHHQIRIVVEGRLTSPWTAELKSACDRAQAECNGRKLVVEVKCLTAISPDGEAMLLELLNEGIRISGCGLFTRQILKLLARKRRKSPHTNTHESPGGQDDDHN